MDSVEKAERWLDSFFSQGCGRFTSRRFGSGAYELFRRILDEINPAFICIGSIKEDTFGGRIDAFGMQFLYR